MNYIIRIAEIEAMEGLAKTHFLNANAQRINKSLGDVVGLKNMGFHIIEVNPGHESTEYHVHQHEEECVYILAGRATVTIDEVDHEDPSGAGCRRCRRRRRSGVRVRRSQKRGPRI